MTKHLSSRQLRSLEKIGDVMLPGYLDAMPSFSQLNCSRHANRILDHMPEQDLGDLKMLLTVFSFFPLFLVRWIMRFLELSPNIPGPVRALLRFMRIGLRGLVMSLYYCDPKALKVIDYEVKVYTGDLPQASQ